MNDGAKLGSCYSKSRYKFLLFYIFFQNLAKHGNSHGKTGLFHHPIYIHGEYVGGAL